MKKIEIKNPKIAEIIREIVNDSKYIRDKIRNGKKDEIKTERPDLYEKMMKGAEAAKKAFEKHNALVVERQTHQF